jgi:hypothetical protein
MHLGMGERDPLEQAQRHGQLGARRLEELQPRRRIEEEVAHLHRGAGGRGDGQGRLRRAAFAAQQRPLDRALDTGQQREAAHRADRGQGLAAEAERLDGVEIRVGGDLGCRVPREGPAELFRGHAHAIVAHADELAAGIA